MRRLRRWWYRRHHENPNCLVGHWGCDCLDRLRPFIWGEGDDVFYDYGEALAVRAATRGR